MPAQLLPFPSRDNSALQVFCPDKTTVLASFEDYLPKGEDISKLSGGPDLPVRLCWLKDNHDYYAYLPKRRLFDGHLLGPLNQHRVEHIQKGGQWFVDDETRKLWGSLDNKLTCSIGVASAGMLVDLNHHEPGKAVDFGFTCGHKTKVGLCTSLEMSKNAFVHRLAYLIYVISYQFQWGVDLVDQEWWKALGASCRRTWVDSVWEAIYRQWEARDFIGVVVSWVSCSVRWLQSALIFGIPIWVSFPSQDAYEKLDGGFVMKAWLPTKEQVAESRRAAMAKLAALCAEPSADDPIDLSPEPSANPPTQLSPDSEPPRPPSHLPLGAKWYKSWEEFFQTPEKDDRKHFETAPEDEKSTWLSWAKNAEKFHAPGGGGARVFVWEACDSGRFVRILHDQSDVERDWDFWYKETLIFNPRRNFWDHCPFRWKPAVKDRSPDNEDNEDDNILNIMEHWYIEPGPPTTLPEDNPLPLEFLYRRYGYLSIDPSPPPNLTIIIPFKVQATYCVIGLEPENSGEVVKHLNQFISNTIAREIPNDHCDLSKTSPPNEMFQQTWKWLIHDTVTLSRFPELSEDVAFTFTSTNNDSWRLVIHDSLTVLEVARAGTAPKLEAQLKYLMLNGSQFTLLYPRTRPSFPPSFNILTFPIQYPSWEGDKEEFQAYMSRLRTLFHEHPYIAAAAFSRGGIAWRIAREVLGIEGSLDTLLNAHPDQGSSVIMGGNKLWYHKVHEGKWFYLVGGYEILTGWLIPGLTQK